MPSSARSYMAAGSTAQDAAARAFDEAFAYDVDRLSAVLAYGKAGDAFALVEEAAFADVLAAVEELGALDPGAAAVLARLKAGAVYWREETGTLAYYDPDAYKGAEGGLICWDFVDTGETDLDAVLDGAEAGEADYMGAAEAAAEIARGGWERVA